MNDGLWAGLLQNCPMRIDRGGYSLIEVVVALLVFTVGALALTAGSAVIARSMSVNAARARAIRAAESRLEAIRARCGGPAGTDMIDGVASSWSSTTDGSGVIIRASASYVGAQGAHTEIYESAVLCAQ